MVDYRCLGCKGPFVLPFVVGVALRRQLDWEILYIEKDRYMQTQRAVLIMSPVNATCFGPYGPSSGV
jgi:hypothetical protein